MLECGWSEEIVVSVKYTIDLRNRYVVDRLKNASQQFLPVAISPARLSSPLRVGGASDLLLSRE